MQQSPIGSGIRQAFFYMGIWYLVSVPSAESQERDVGTIKLDGSQSCFVVNRKNGNSETPPKKVGVMLLYPGDKICLARDKQECVVSVLGFRPLELNNPNNSCHEVKETATSPFFTTAKLPEVWKNFWKWFEKERGNEKVEESRTEVFGNQPQMDPPPLNIPMLMLLPKVNNMLVEGTRKLQLGWIGGNMGNYHLTVICGEKLLKISGQDATTQKGLNVQQVVLEEHSFSVNQTCKVSLNDGGFPIIGQFTIVPKETVQSVLKWTEEMKAVQELDDKNKEAFLAAVLAGQPGWQLEAYQRVSSIKDHEPEPAHYVAEGIRRGIPYPLLPE